MPIKNVWSVKSHVLTKGKKIQSGQEYSGLVPDFLQPGTPRQCSEQEGMGCKAVMSQSLTLDSYIGEFVVFKDRILDTHRILRAVTEVSIHLSFFFF